jgi:hypothetical protein
VKFDGKAAAYDELMESEFGMKDEMLECEVWNELRCRAWWAALPERLEELEHNKLSSMMTEGLGIEHGKMAVEESTASSWMSEQCVRRGVTRTGAVGCDRPAQPSTEEERPTPLECAKLSVKRPWLATFRLDGGGDHGDGATADGQRPFSRTSASLDATTTWSRTACRWTPREDLRQ